jgi:hypothetical protein
MAKANQQAKRRGNWRGPKKTKQKEEKIPIIGSSCTWGDAELDCFSVRVRTNVDVRKLIPEKFFEFGHLQRYKECILFFLFLTS